MEKDRSSRIKELEDAIQIMVDAADCPHEMVKGNFLTAEIMRDAFAKGKPTHAGMNAHDYVSLRTLYKDVLDIESEALLAKRGLMASMDGVCICVSRNIKMGEVKFLNYETKKAYQINLVEKLTKEE